MPKIRCILLIDDDAEDNEYHEIIIKEAGLSHHTRIALNGIEALDYLVKSRDPGNEISHPIPDLIFLDINMPKMNGFEFLEEYRQLPDNLKSGIIVVMLTTSINPDDDIRARAINEVKFFKNKPLTVDMLREIVKLHF